MDRSDVSILRGRRIWDSGELGRFRLAFKFAGCLGFPCPYLRNQVRVAHSVCGGPSGKCFRPVAM